MVEANNFNHLFNKRYNLCYGCCLKQLQRRPAVKAATHPSINQANYRQLIEELWNTNINEDAQEGQGRKENVTN